MAKEVFDYQDLVRLIYSFGFPEHRLHTKKVCNQLLYHHYRRTDKPLAKDLLSPVPNLMKHHRDWNLYVDFFVYKRCMCCSRHSHRKPSISLEEGTIVFDWGNETMVPEAMDRNDCDCECRHNCRRIINRLAYIDD